MNEIRIYVACLAAYNTGNLHGKWIDCALGYDHIQNEIKAMLATSPEHGAEEFAIHDYEGFGAYTVDEYDCIEKITELAEAIEKYGPIISAIMNYQGYDDVSDAIREYANNYQGEFKSLENWAYKFLTETGALSEVPEHLRNYINFEAYARDARLGGEIYEIEDRNTGKIHVLFTY